MSNKPLTLNDYCEFIVDCLHKTAPIEETETGFYSIRTPDIGRGRLIIENANRVSKETYEKWTIRAVPQAGDLILAREAPVGNIGIVPENVKVCCGQRTVHLRPDKSQIDPEYLVYLMNGDEIQGKIKGYSQGVTVAHLNMEDIRALVLPELPPRPIQRKIANIISTYDNLIENNMRRIRILEQMAQAIYQEWFGNVDKEYLPEGWKLKSLGEIIDFKNGKAINAEVEGDFPIYGSNGIIGRTNEARYKNAIIIGRVGAYCGSINYCSTQFSASDNTIIASPSPNSGFAENFAYRLLMNMNLRRFAGGAAQPLMTQSVLNKLETLVPPSSLCLEYEKIAGNLFSLQTILEKENANLRQTRDLLLPRLVSGEIELQ